MKEILIAGFGGQGVLATGVILANAALRADLQTCWLPSYGGTMRGGTANCSVKISDDENTRDDIHVICEPVTEIATELGNVRAANVVMLGVILSHLPMVSLDAAKISLEEYFEPKGQKMIDFNRNALEVGYARKG